MWKIEYFSESVAREIFALPAGQLARYLRYTAMMEEYGANLGMPHTRAMGDGLYEIRLAAADGIARVLYCSPDRKRIIMLHSFVKKTQKTPDRELETALRRMREVKRK